MKKFEVDLLEIQKKERFFKKAFYVLVGVEIIFILLGTFNYFSLKNKREKLFSEYKKAEQTINEFLRKRESDVKKAIDFKRKLKKDVDFINSKIEAKAFDFRSFISEIKSISGGVEILGFSLSAEEKISTIKVSSSDYGSIISFKNSLEKKAKVSLLSDEKSENKYVVQLKIELK